MEKKFNDMSKKERLEYLLSLLPDDYLINNTKIDGRENLKKNGLLCNRKWKNSRGTIKRDWISFG